MGLWFDHRGMFRLMYSSRTNSLCGQNCSALRFLFLGKVRGVEGGGKGEAPLEFDREPPQNNMASEVWGESS